MWILYVLPEIAIHLILLVGILGVIAGFLLGFIPFVKQYKLLIQIVSILILTLGVYLEGGLADQKEWQLKVAELETKVKEAEAKSQETNVQVVEKIVKEKQVIREKGKTVTEYVDRVITKYDTKYLPGEKCEIPQEVIKAHDAAASNKAIEVTEKTAIPTDELNKAARGQK